MRLSSLDEPTTAHIVRPGMYVASPADPWLRLMEDEADFQDRMILVTCCLRKDPGCIEAHMLLAACTFDTDVRVNHLRKAVETGEKLWNPIADELGSEMGWWGFAATRPYMRAIQAFGNTLPETGTDAEACACFERLLAMNPNDNQGIRYAIEELEATASGMRV